MYVIKYRNIDEHSKRMKGWVGYFPSRYLSRNARDVGALHDALTFENRKDAQDTLNSLDVQYRDHYEIVLH